MLSLLSQTIANRLRAQILELYGVQYEKLGFTIPPRIELGELALPIAFDLARKLKRPPRDIAEELAGAARQIPGLWKVDVAGAGYLNFHLERAAFSLRFYGTILEGLFGRTPSVEDIGKIVVEHTNINPNKAAHIGHLRNAALGDSFIRCLRYLGHKVEVQNYLDNTGVQVADVVVGLERMSGKTIEDVEAMSGRFDYYCWDLYARVPDFYKLSEENRKYRSLTLQAIEKGANATAELAEHVAMRIARAHLATMKRINVHYDLLPRESDILHLHFWDRAFQLLKERKAIYYVEEGKNRGCWVMRTGDRNDAGPDPVREELEEDEKIIVRSDSTVTYVGKDIAYQLWKFGLLGLDFRYRRFQFPDDGRKIWVTSSDETGEAEHPAFGGASRVYNVIDNRQSYLQSVVLQGLKVLGFEKEAENSIHFSYEMVALSPACCEELGFLLSDEDKKRPFVEVSGRKGLGVKADDLLDALMKKALAEVQSRHDMPREEASEIAGIIAVGALRYFLLKFARNTVIAFDFKEALSFDGETGPYVQYAVVRAGNIFRKLAEAGGSAPWGMQEVAQENLARFLDSHDDIWELVFQSARLPDVVRQVVQSLELAQLSKFAFQLAQKFNLFYHKYHILSEPDLERRANLLFVVEVVRKQLTKALDLLGSEVPQKM